MVERGGRRGNRWLEMIHTREVTSLAKRHDISLDDNLIRFLEEYSEVVLHVTAKQKERKTNQSVLQQELEDVNRVVQDEVNAIREALFPNNEEARHYFFAVQHQETYLPIVHLAIRGLPELLVHVTRTYATRKKGTSFGLLSKSTGGALWGATARAANYLRRRCRDQHWDLSVSEVVNLWYQQALEIPPEERMRPERSPSSVAKRHRSIRRRARLQAEIQASMTTTQRDGKKRKVRIDAVERELADVPNRSPTKKRRRTEAVEPSEMREASETVPENGPYEDAFRKDKTVKPGVAANQEVEANVAKHHDYVATSATTVEKHSFGRKDNKIERGELELRYETLRGKREEVPKKGETEAETKACQHERTLRTRADKRNDVRTKRTRKLVASAFLTSSSQARNRGQDGDFKQVEIDEGFDTIGGMGDYDSEESDNESGDHNGEHALPVQQIRFEQVHTDSVDKTGNSDNEGGIVEVGKTTEMDRLHSASKEQKFASYRFADALSAVNLAGNDEGANHVKREDEEHVM